jgi:hypothetical protein
MEKSRIIMLPIDTASTHLQPYAKEGLIGGCTLSEFLPYLLDSVRPA